MFNHNKVGFSTRSTPIKGSGAADDDVFKNSTTIRLALNSLILLLLVNYIYLFSRKKAQMFYEKFGFLSEGDYFKKENISYIKMYKTINDIKS